MRRKIFRSALIVAAIIGGYAAYMTLTTNFHTVLPGKLYRSAQPSGEDILEWHQRYGIKTIINLRGPHPNRPWYEVERTVAESNGMTMIDYKMSAQRSLTADDVKELLGILAKAETPVLIHCRSGADRSGLVSAVYVAGVAGGSEFYAEMQLTPYYGHFPLWFFPFWAMDTTFEDVEPLLGFPDS